MYINTEYLLHILKDNYILIIILLFITYLYYNQVRTYSYFRDRGIPYQKPSFIGGNIGPWMFKQMSLHDLTISMYNHFDGLPYAGIFDGRKPRLLLRDPDLIKTVLIKESDHFIDRSGEPLNDPPYIKKMMFNLRGKEWKNVRGSLTSAFSSGKLRNMEKLVELCAKQTIEHLESRKDIEDPVEMKDIMGKYALEVVGSCAFGLDCTSLKNSESTFVKMAGSLLDVPLWKKITFFLVSQFLPTMLRTLPLSFINQEAAKQLRDVVLETKSQRESSNLKRRDDFLQLMLDIQKNEKIEGIHQRVMTDDVVQAQAILFLFAGSDTTSSVLSFACYELARHQNIQDTLRNELFKISDRNNEETLYDALNGVSLIEKVLSETMRMYSPTSRTPRVCTKPITLPGTNVHLKENDVVVIPLNAIMLDPKYYPDPYEFDPERFSSEGKLSRPSHCFLPFGLGPRNCIGMRFALMSAKCLIYNLLLKFRLEVCEKTEYPIVYDKASILLKPQNGIWLKLKPLI